MTRAWRVAAAVLFALLVAFVCTVAALIVLAARPSEAAQGRCTFGEWVRDGKLHRFSHAETVGRRTDYLYEVLRTRWWGSRQVVGVLRVKGCPTL